MCPSFEDKYSCGSFLTQKMTIRLYKTTGIEIYSLIQNFFMKQSSFVFCHRGTPKTEARYQKKIEPRKTKRYMALSRRSRFFPQ